MRVIGSTFLIIGIALAQALASDAPFLSRRDAAEPLRSWLAEQTNAVLQLSRSNLLVITECCGYSNTGMHCEITQGGC